MTAIVGENGDEYALGIGGAWSENASDDEAGQSYVAHLVWRHASPSTLGSSAGSSKKSAEVLTVAQFNLLNALLGYCLDTPTRLLKRLEPQIVAVVRTRLIKQQVEGLFKQHFPTETLPKEDVAWAKKMLHVVSRT